MRLLSFHNVCLVRFACAVLPALPMAAAVAADDIAPYEARIVTPGAPVHSGPGEDFYPTDTLAQGDVVEVYRERPGGWLGIRPPEGSFSWLFGRHANLLENGLAEINKDDVPSRIGSRLGERRSAAQIQLKKGEIVEVLSQETVGGESWYKIAPPSGEFRWIHARHVAPRGALVADEPAELAGSSAPPVVTVPEIAGDEAHADPNVALVADAQPVADLSSDKNWRASPIATTAEAAVRTAPAAGAAASEPAPQTAGAQPTTSAAVANATPQPVAGVVDDGLARQLIDLELRLSRMVTEPPTSWQIVPLRQEAGQLLSAAKTDGERAAVNMTISKLDRFAGIAQRYQQTDKALSSLPSAISQTPTDTRHGSAELAAGLTPETSKYDAIGILRPVVSRRPGAPQFALVDERGQVVSFVTPTPDTNLQPYLGHRIGITGSRGFIPEFQRAHVTAGRVSPLGERLVR